MNSDMILQLALERQAGLRHQAEQASIARISRLARPRRNRWHTSRATTSRDS